MVHKLLLLAFGVVGLLAALVVVELFIRAALIYLVAAFCPLFFAAGIWEPMRGGIRKLGELAFGLIISKLGIAAALAVCSAAIVSVAPGGQPTAIPTPEQAAMQAQQSSAQTVGILVSAITMFCVAAFMPFVLWRLLPIAESAAVGHGIRGAPVRGTQFGTSTAAMAFNNPATVALRMRRSSGRGRGIRCGRRQEGSGYGIVGGAGGRGRRGDGRRGEGRESCGQGPGPRRGRPAVGEADWHPVGTASPGFDDRAGGTRRCSRACRETRPAGVGWECRRPVVGRRPGPLRAAIATIAAVAVAVVPAVAGTAAGFRQARPARR